MKRMDKYREQNLLGHAIDYWDPVTDLVDLRMVFVDI